MSERSRIAILGGAKVSNKIGLIQHLLPMLDQLLIGGNSLVEVEKLDAVKSRPHAFLV